MLKEMGRTKSKVSTIKCNNCKYKNEIEEMDCEIIGKLKIFYCKNCGKEVK